MPGPIHSFLSQDHARLDALLIRATSHPEVVDAASYADFRAGLLRHIAIEEKVLFAAARAHPDRVPKRVIDQLHADHAALASLLVPPPTHDLLATVRGILGEHNSLEEGPGGIYDLCEQLAGDDVAAQLARAHAILAVRASQHLDEPRVHEHIERMVAARAWKSAR